MKSHPGFQQGNFLHALAPTGLATPSSVEIIDDGSAGTPVVKGDLYAAEGHGLFLVQHLAAQWG
jgi:hypothetical protein